MNNKIIITFMYIIICTFLSLYSRVSSTAIQLADTPHCMVSFMDVYTILVGIYWDEPGRALPSPFNCLYFIIIMTHQYTRTKKMEKRKTED